jgi:hypothetical protein
MTLSYQLADLGPLGSKLGGGTQGTVYALQRDPSLAFKRYKNATNVDEITLSALVGWLVGLTPTERALLQDTTAWPRALVREGQRVVGIVMARAPARFAYVCPDGTSAPTTLAHAITPDRPHVRQNIPIPSQTERLLLAHSLCRLLAIFERNGLLFLDLSSKNIRWSLKPKPEIFLLDCDSASLMRRPNPARTVRTPNWHDPWWRDPPSREEVRGLFCLVFARLVFARPYPNDKSCLVLWPQDNPLAKSFQALVDDGYSPDLAHRPCMATWQARIEEVQSQGYAAPPQSRLPTGVAHPRPLTSPSGGVPVTVPPVRAPATGTRRRARFVTAGLLALLAIAVYKEISSNPQFYWISAPHLHDSTPASSANPQPSSRKIVKGLFGFGSAMAWSPDSQYGHWGHILTEGNKARCSSSIPEPIKMS